MNKIYEKLILKDKTNLKWLIDEVRDNLTIEQNDSLSEFINNATKGSNSHKKVVKKEIANYLARNHPQISEDTIDSIIKQYYINYYENLFADNTNDLDEYEKKIFNYFEKFHLNKNSAYEKKYMTLASIIYQENYGLGAIDDVADDIENINGIWTNNKKDVYIQFNGVKKRVKGLFFENSSAYKNVIKNATAYDSTFDISGSDPIVFCSRKNGSRVTAIMQPVGIKPYLNIRNFSSNISSLDDLVKLNSISKDIRDLLVLLVKGRPNFSVIGQMGSGKTTFLRALMSIYNKRLSILTVEASDELRLYEFLTGFDVRSHIYSKKNPPDICLEAAYREDRDIILQGEVRTAQEAYNAIYVKNKVAKGSGDTYHANGFKEYMITRRNLLMETGKYQDYHQAEMDLAYSEDILFIFNYNTRTGQRYLEKILEIETFDDTYKERVLIAYKNNKWVSPVGSISTGLAERLSQESDFDEEYLKGINGILKSLKEG